MDKPRESIEHSRYPRAWLRFVEPDGTMTLERLGGEPFTIGRRPEHDLTIPHDSVSRDHARITYSDGRFWIEDLGSRTGTFVEGQRIHRVALFQSAAIRIGNATDYRLTYQRLLEHLDEEGQRRALLAALREAHDLRAMLEATRSMAASASLEDALDRFLEVLVHITDARKGTMLLLAEPGAEDMAVERTSSGESTVTFRSPEERPEVVADAIRTARVTGGSGATVDTNPSVGQDAGGADEVDKQKEPQRRPGDGRCVGEGRSSGAPHGELAGDLACGVDRGVRPGPDLRADESALVGADAGRALRDLLSRACPRR